MARRKKSGLDKWAAAKAPKTDWSKVDPSSVVQKEHGDPEPAGQRDMFAGYEHSRFNKPAHAAPSYSQHEDKGKAAAIERGQRSFEDREKEDAQEKKLHDTSEAAYAHHDAAMQAERKGDKALALFHAKQSFKNHIAAHNLAVDRYGKDSATAKDHGAEAERASKKIGELGGKSPGFTEDKHPRDDKGRFTGL